MQHETSPNAPEAVQATNAAGVQAPAVGNGAGGIKDSLQGQLSAIEPSAAAEQSALFPDQKSKKEEQEIALDQLDQSQQLANQRAALENRSFESDIVAREKYANCIFRLIVWWISAILMVLLLQGFLSEREISLKFHTLGMSWHIATHFKLSEPVLLALIGGTTASVLGLFAIVANYLFPKK